MHPSPIPDYTLDHLIGEGSTGSVWVARYLDQAPVALKAFKGLAINRQLLSDALVRIYEGSGHPGLVKVHDFDLASPQAYVTMDLCVEEVHLADGQTSLRPRNLEALCGALSQDDGWRIALQIADALAFLHRERIIHADLKPSNVLFGEGENPRAMINDFSQGMLGGIEQIEPQDSLFYAPPEQLRDPDHFFEGRAERWDVYRFGATVFRLLTGRMPRLHDPIDKLLREGSKELDFYSDIDREQLAMALEMEPELRWTSEADSEIEVQRRHIIERCLQLEPRERYVDLREVLEAFREAESEQGHHADIASFKEAQVEMAESAKGAKRRATVFGLGAAVAAGVAVFGLMERFGGGSPEEAGGSVEGAAPAAADAEREVIRPPADPPVPARNEELEAAKAQLAGALDDLRHSGAALDAVFELIAARDAQGNPLYSFPDGTLGTVLNYYEEFANRHASVAEMAETVAQAHNNSGELQLMLGDLEAARDNLSRAAELFSELETGGGEAGDLLKRRARVHDNLSDAYTASRRPDAAIEQAKLADAAFKQLAELDGDSPVGRRMLAASSLSLGRKLSEANQPGEAGIYVQRAATLLRKMEDEQIVNEGDLALLAAICFERGRIERALGKREEAVKAQIEAIDRYLALIEALPEIGDYRFQLARAYGEAADLASLLGEPGEAKVANGEASRLLRDLAERAPDQAAIRFELARRLRAGAAALRDAGSAKSAMEEGEKTIVLLEDLKNSQPDDPGYAYELAIVCGLQADMLGEAKRKEEALKYGKQAVSLMQTLLAEDLDPAANNSKRPRYRHALAALYGKLGHHSESGGEKDAALHCFEKSLKQYQALTGIDPDDQTANKGIAWAEDRISRLQ